MTKHTKANRTLLLLLAALLAALIIAAVTFVICSFGLHIGKKAGNRLGGRAEILGGCILIFIGIEIFVKSFFYHPVVPYTAVLVGCYVISHTLNIFSKGKIKAMMFRPAYLYVMIAIIVIQCVIKNVFVIMNGTHLI